jgi:membrane protein
VVDLFTRFGNDNGAFYAAGLAFFVLLSFVPIILTIVAVLACFVDVHIASERVTELIRSMLPRGGPRIEATKFLTSQINLDEQLRTIILHRDVAGFFGILSLVWATVQIFVNTSVAMNAMWEVRESRNWFQIRGITLFLMLVTGSLSFLSLALSSPKFAIGVLHLPLIGRLPTISTVSTIVLELVALIVNCIMYLLIYKLLPNAKVSWMASGIGGLTAGVFFEVAKKGLAVYFLKANHSVYGDLENLVLFVLWIYYSMMILLLGAEVTASVCRARGENQNPSDRTDISRHPSRGEKIQRMSKSHAYARKGHK